MTLMLIVFVLLSGALLIAFYLDGKTIERLRALNKVVQSAYECALNENWDANALLQKELEEGRNELEEERRENRNLRHLVNIQREDLVKSEALSARLRADCLRLANIVVGEARRANRAERLLKRMTERPRGARGRFLPNHPK